MNLIEHIKEFLATKGLNWTGEIEYNKKHKKERFADFRQAEIGDFEIEGKPQTIVIDFGKDGQIALIVVIDLINFKIEGTAPEYGLTCYAGDNDENVELCIERDLSTEWNEYMLVNGGLVYRTAIIQWCANKKESAQQCLKKRISDLDRKIGYLENKKDYARQVYDNKIHELTKLENKVKNYNVEI